MTRVFITGVGAVTPFGVGFSFLRNGLKSGESTAKNISLLDTEAHKCKISCEVPDWDPLKHLDPKESRQMDRFTQFAMASSQEAIEDSGIDFEKMDPYRVGVNVSSGIGGMWEHHAQFDKYFKKGPRYISPFYIPKNISNIAPGWISIKYGLKGYSSAPVAACATGTIAIGEAFNLIRNGTMDAMVTGGAEGAIAPTSLAGFSNMKALACNFNDNPKEASRPFDLERSGFVMGEGSVVFVLESEENLKSRGGTPIAEVVGFAVTSDAYHITSPNLNGESPAKAMSLALEDAQIPSSAVDYLNAHGTSTKFNDLMETNAIKLTFSNDLKKINISSTKGMHGHLLGAAGAIECAACIVSMRDKIIPPTINYNTKDPDCDLDYTPNDARDFDVNVSMSNSFAFGGHNTSLVLRSS